MGSINFGETTNNPYDTSFGYANVALGIFNTYSQASKFIESGIVYLGVEPYIQDNWKVNNRLTLDYGVRFVHLIPEHDKYMQASNFFPDQWNRPRTHRRCTWRAARAASIRARPRARP